jgi:hypothetical protein
MKLGCPNCGDIYEVDDDLAGKVILCRCCSRRLRVPWPEHPAAETRAPVLWVAGAAALLTVGLLLATVAVFVLQARHQAEERLAAEAVQRAEVERERVARKQVERDLAEVKRQVQRQAEVQQERDEQARRQAAKQSAAEALAAVRKRVAELVDFDAKNRSIATETDRKSIELLVQHGRDPNDLTQSAVRLYHEQRQKLISNGKTALSQLLTELRQALYKQFADAAYPADIKQQFDLQVGEELRRLEALVNAPYPDIQPIIRQAVARHELHLANLTAKSKRAGQALIKYHHDLPERADGAVTAFNFEHAYLFMTTILELYTEKKLTRESGLQALNALPLTLGSHWKYAKVLRHYVAIGGDWRTNHDPKQPSVAEAFAEFRRVVNYDAIEDEWLNHLPRSDRP